MQGWDVWKLKINASLEDFNATAETEVASRETTIR